jgi:hypothetical protein
VKFGVLFRTFRIISWCYFKLQWKFQQCQEKVARSGSKIIVWLALKNTKVFQQIFNWNFLILL